MTIPEMVEKVVDRIKKAKEVNDQLQRQQTPGSPAWHHCETIDDHLFEALRLVGD